MGQLPALKRFDVTVYRKRSTSDPAQVPADSTIQFYRQGATVETATSVLVSPSFEVKVFNTGNFAVGDLVQVNTAATPEMTVVKLDPGAGKIWLANASGGSVPLAQFDRLIVKSNQPSIYLDPAGTLSLGTSIATSAGGPSPARAVGYLREFRFDYIVTLTISGEATLYVDAEASFAMR